MDPELAEAHGGWKPGNASRYSRFNLSSVFNLSKNMVGLQAVPPPYLHRVGADADAVAAEAVDVEDEEDADEEFFPRTEEADGADDEDVDAWSPGQNVARPAWRPTLGAGGSNDPLPPRVQPVGPLAVVPQVADGPHAYVGAALRMVANSPPSRAFTRLQALIRQ